MKPPQRTEAERIAGRRDDLARVIVRSRGAVVTASDELWPGAAAHYHEMVATWPDYANGRSLVTDAYRTADAVIAHLLSQEQTDER